jgi:hypothetical protein
MHTCVPLSLRTCVKVAMCTFASAQLGRWNHVPGLVSGTVASLPIFSGGERCGPRPTSTAHRRACVRELKIQFRQSSADDWSRMPKGRSTTARKDGPFLSGSAEIEAMVARTAPAVLMLLADGVARPRSAIISALAGQHPKEDVIRTLMRLSVTGRLIETERKYSLPATAEPEGEGR